jgi:hypothetical protein
VEFKALFQAVIDRDARNKSELAVIKGRILSPTSGVGFTPRKKPRYLDLSWDSAELDILPPLKEDPGMQDEEGLSNHILEQWKGTIQTVEDLKKAASQNNWYEQEMESLGNDIYSLRLAMARVNDFLGSPNGYGIDEGYHPCHPELMEIIPTHDRGKGWILQAHW